MKKEINETSDSFEEKKNNVYLICNILSLFFINMKRSLAITIA